MSSQWKKPMGVFLWTVRLVVETERVLVPECWEASEKGYESQEGHGDDEDGDGAREGHFGR